MEFKDVQINEYYRVWGKYELMYRGWYNKGLEEIENFLKGVTKRIVKVVDKKENGAIYIEGYKSFICADWLTEM